MRDQHASQPKSPPRLWEELIAWAQGLAPWRRYILGLAASHGRLDASQIESAYALFLAHRKLGPQPEGVSVTQLAARPTEPLSQALRVTRLDGISGVNALPADASLAFGPEMTVIYGGNGAGKSSFARLLANACFSRQPPTIIDNIYTAGQASPRATFHVSVGDGAETAVAYPAKDEVTPLKRITVFDTAVARHHVSQVSAFEFKPAGFEVFPEMTRVYGALEARLDTDIAKRSRPNTFLASFLGGGTAVHAAVAALSANTDPEALRKLGAYGPSESARLAELEEQLVALRSKSPKALLGERRQAQADITALGRQLTDRGAAFSPTAVAARAARIADAEAKAKAAETLGSDQFMQPFFRAVGTVQWKSFAAHAHSLAAAEDAEYPRASDRCLLCERPLDDASRAHVEALLRFVESDAQREANDAARSLAEEAARLQRLDLTILAPTTRVHGHVLKLSPVTETSVADALKSLSKSQAAAIQDLTGFTQTAAPADVAGALEALRELEVTLKADIDRLAADDTDASIASLEDERRVLRHRHVLSQNLASIEEWIADAKWAQGARAVRPDLNTRPVTEKERDLFAAIVGENYRTRLATECETLGCTVPVELRTVGRDGQTVRQLTMPGGHRPEAILSEGEQRAVALADFLTEVSQNPAGAGIVLDDPVTSQDHERKARIALRLVEEARTRQVVVFTHDLVFLSQLTEAAEKAQRNLHRHWIQRGDGHPGIVTLNDAPGTEKTYDTTERAKAALARAKTFTGSDREAEIRKGMGALRRTLEETVVRRLLKGVVQRWGDRVMVTTLKKIRWDDGQVQAISDLFEDLSALMEGHTHTDIAMGAPPEVADLEKRIAKVDALIAWARAERT